MIKVIPFIQTTGSEKFREFLELPFTKDILYPINSIKSTALLFEDWKCKEMTTWQRFSNSDKIILEFYPSYYVIRKDTANAIKYMLSIPKTINDFINDMDRFGVQLYWTEWIDQNFEPKDYLHPLEIEKYYVNLLGKLRKSHELQ